MITKILHMVLKIEDKILWKVKPEKNRIEFFTNESTELEGNFKEITQELENRGYTPNFYGVKFKGSLKDKIRYFFVCLNQLYRCKKAEVVILNDNNYVISTIKPDHLKVCQIWHASGAVKKFGNQLKQRKYKISGYDRVFCCGKYWKDIFSKAFNIERDKVVITGLPDTDTIYMEREKEPEQVISYLPTFRGNSMDGIRWVDLDTEKIKKDLPEGWVFQTRYHPLIPKESDTTDSTLDCIKKSKIVITDYSSVLFDTSLLKDRVILLYVPDLEGYGKEIGYNINIEEDFRGYIAKTEDELYKLIIQAIEGKLKENSCKIRNKYMEGVDGQSVKAIADEIERLLCKENEYWRG